MNKRKLGDASCSRGLTSGQPEPACWCRPLGGLISLCRQNKHGRPRQAPASIRVTTTNALEHPLSFHRASAWRRWSLLLIGRWLIDRAGRQAGVASFVCSVRGGREIERHGTAPTARARTPGSCRAASVPPTVPVRVGRNPSSPTRTAAAAGL